MNKLYVWYDVFCDYTCGIAFAIAGGVEEARSMIAYELGYTRDEIMLEEPTVYDLTEKMAYTLWGGA